MRIGFLFNHDQVHQVAHALPIALAMRKNNPWVEVVAITTNDQLSEEVRHLSARVGLPIDPVQIGLTSGLTRFAARHLETVLPITKIGVYRDNLALFRGFDALVVAEKTSLLLKSRYGLDNLKIIHTRHGAGDRAIGFNKASAGFDHVLVSGSKIRDRLIRDAGLAPDSMSTVGYPKFDLMPEKPPRLPIQANGKPTVLYNPHPSPHLSSWFEDGRDVLEYFLNDQRYNLIFAPHVMLFHRKFVVTIDKLKIDRPGRIEQRFYDAPNIHIDLGSRASTDMTYTAAADIYLGDVSSQIYEFLHRPKPCLFIDSHGVDWRGNANYTHWQAGDVIPGATGLGDALDRAVQGHYRYRPIQRELFQRSFELTAERSADRASRAIMGVLAPSAPMPMFDQRPMAPMPAEVATGARAAA